MGSPSILRLSIGRRNAPSPGRPATLPLTLDADDIPRRAAAIHGESDPSSGARFGSWRGIPTAAQRLSCWSTASPIGELTDLVIDGLATGRVARIALDDCKFARNTDPLRGRFRVQLRPL
jgi:hypothetical protein